MKENKKQIINRNKGITLVALVITIIILLILAGISIASLTGSGLFSKARLAEKNYQIASIKERVEIELASLEIDRIGKTKLTIEEALNELIGKGIFDTIDGEENIGYIDNYEVKLKYNESGRVIVEYVEKATGVIASYKLEPSGYTNAESVKIIFKVKGKVKNVTKPDETVVTAGNNGVIIEYPVANNGEYLFKIENEEGEKIDKEVKVDIIDRVTPKAFTITAESIEEGLKINGSTEDEETREEGDKSVKSGIQRYEYYYKLKTSTGGYNKSDTNIIADLEYGEYNLYVKAVDRAGNPKDSTVLTFTYNNWRTSIIGAKVTNYTCVNSAAVSEWKVFYIDEEDNNRIYLIAVDEIPNSYVPAGKKGSTMRKDSDGYSCDFGNIRNDYTGSADITDERLKKLNSKFTATSTDPNMKFVAYMLDINAWNKFAGEYADYAIGGATLDQVFKSIKQKYNKDFETKQTTNTWNNSGLVFREKGTSEWVGHQELTFIPQDCLYTTKMGIKYGFQYMLALASPYNGADNRIFLFYNMNNPFQLYLTYADFNKSYDLLFKPVVCLNEKTKLQSNGNGTYSIVIEEE